MSLYPLMAVLESKPVVIIGGGNTALRKFRALIETGAQIKIISPQIHEEIIELAEENGKTVEIIQREYMEKDIENAFMIFLTTDDPGLNSSIYEKAQKKNILINTADDPSKCSFITPSFARRGKLLLSVTTEGASPAYAARLRRELERHLPHNIEKILESLQRARTILKKNPDFSQLDSLQRGRILKYIVNSDSALKKILKSGNDDIKTALILKSFLKEKRFNL